MCPLSVKDALLQSNVSDFRERVAKSGERRSERILIRPRPSEIQENIAIRGRSRFRRREEKM